jgi:hypothetical protein
MSRKGGEAVAEKPTHKRTVAREAGPKGRKEVPVRGGRLDAATQGRAIEVERSGSPTRLTHAAQKLKASGGRQHVLAVPEQHMAKAREAMRKAGVAGTVKNLAGTKAQHVGARRATLKHRPRSSGRGKSR